MKNKSVLLLFDVLKAGIGSIQRRKFANLRVATGDEMESERANKEMGECKFNLHHHTIQWHCFATTDFFVCSSKYGDICWVVDAKSNRLRVRSTNHVQTTLTILEMNM